MPPRRGAKAGPSAGSATARAANLLSKARAAAAATPSAAASSATSQKRPNASASASSSTLPPSLPGTSWGDGLAGASVAEPRQEPTNVPLPQLLKQLTSRGLSMLEAMPIAGKLIKGGFAIPEKLALLSSAALQDMGVEGEETRRKVITAFAGKRTAAMMKAASGGGSETSPKRRRRDDDETLSREWGNVAGPSSTSRPLPPSAFVFNEILDEVDVRGRYAFVNRAPIMTAWTTIVLERLGFNRAEALSLSHCYVSHTSTARGIAIGVIPASERNKAVNFVSPSQPHFELMGVKIPVMQIAGDQWRGLSGGEVVGPERAFNYLRKSMFQTLPLVMGALILLADSYLNPPTAQATSPPRVKEEVDIKQESLNGASTAEVPIQPKEEPSEESDNLDQAVALADSSEYGPEVLHAEAYRLYVAFRPETGGAWGKRARFELGKVLALRKGHEQELEEWEAKEAKKEAAQEGQVDEAEEKALEEDIQRMIDQEGQGAEEKQDAEAIKQETIKQEP